MEWLGISRNKSSNYDTSILFKLYTNIHDIQNLRQLMSSGIIPNRDGTSFYAWAPQHVWAFGPSLFSLQLHISNNIHVYIYIYIYIDIIHPVCMYIYIYIFIMYEHIYIYIWFEAIYHAICLIAKLNAMGLACRLGRYPIVVARGWNNCSHQAMWNISLKYVVQPLKTGYRAS